MVLWPIRARVLFELFYKLGCVNIGLRWFQVTIICIVARRSSSRVAQSPKRIYGQSNSIETIVLNAYSQAK